MATKEQARELVTADERAHLLRIGKRIAREAKPYRELQYVTEQVGAEIWCLVPRALIRELRDMVGTKKRDEQTS